MGDIVGQHCSFDRTQNCHGHGNVLVSHMSDAELPFPLRGAWFCQIKANTEGDASIKFTPFTDFTANAGSGRNGRNCRGSFG